MIQKNYNAFFYNFICALISYFDIWMLVVKGIAQENYKYISLMCFKGLDNVNDWIDEN